MKDKSDYSPDLQAEAEEALYKAVLAIRDADGCKDFFRDLCTPAELQALADRWTVVRLLRQNLTYREIHDQTGVSVTTVGRVARCLVDGHGGYQAVADRLEL